MLVLDAALPHVLAAALAGELGEEVVEAEGAAVGTPPRAHRQVVGAHVERVLPQLLVPEGQRVEVLHERGAGPADDLSPRVLPPQVGDGGARPRGVARDFEEVPASIEPLAELHDGVLALAHADEVDRVVLQADLRHRRGVDAPEDDRAAGPLLHAAGHLQAPLVGGGEDAEGEEVRLQRHRLLDDPRGAVEDVAQAGDVEVIAVVEEGRVEGQRRLVPGAPEHRREHRDAELLLPERDEDDPHRRRW